MLGYALFLAVFAAIEVSSYGSLGYGPGDRTSFVTQLGLIGRQTSYLVDMPVHLEVLAGYIQWFLLGFFGVFYSVWGLIAGTAAIRADEEKGLLEQWFAVGVSPARLVFARLLAFTIAAAASAGLVVAAALLLALTTGQRLPAGATFVQAAIQLGPAVAFFAFGMLAAQLFPTRRNALGAAGLVAVALLLLNGFSRSVDWLRPANLISPFAYPDRSHLMTPGGGFEPISVLPWLVALLIAGLAANLHARRDLGASWFQALPRGDRPPGREPSANPLLGIPALNVVWEQRLGLAAWSAGIIVYAVTNVPLAKPFQDFFSKGSSLTALQARVAFGFSGRDPVIGFVSAEWFHTACLMLAVYAVTQVSRWAADDSDGRLEMILSTGIPRWRVIAERALALVAAASVIALANVAGVMAGAAVSGINLDFGRVIWASFLILPVAMAFGAVGAAISAIRPRPAVVILIVILAVSYLTPLMGVPIFHKSPPDWYTNLSVFQLYGSPLVDGVSWWGFGILAAVTALGFGVSLLAIRNRDVGS